ncbi:MAG: hypothetical protein RID91_16120 [Azospirillaceae bacterium]
MAKSKIPPDESAAKAALYDAMNEAEEAAAGKVSAEAAARWSPDSLLALKTRSPLARHMLEYLGLPGPDERSTDYYMAVPLMEAVVWRLNADKLVDLHWSFDPPGVTRRSVAHHRAHWMECAGMIDVPSFRRAYRYLNRRSPIAFKMRPMWPGGPNRWCATIVGGPAEVSLDALQQHRMTLDARSGTVRVFGHEKQARDGRGRFK